MHCLADHKWDMKSVCDTEPNYTISHQFVPQKHHGPRMGKVIMISKTTCYTHFWLGSSFPEIMQSKSSPPPPSWQLTTLGCDKDDHAHHYFSLSLSSPAGAFHILHRHPSTLNCNVTPSLRPSTVCLIWTPSKTTHAAVFCLSCIHLIHMLCIIALDGLETCGTHFISVLLFGFLFSSVFVICITLFCFSVIVLRMAMVPDCLAYWTTLKRCISWSENTPPLYAVQHIQMWINIYNL